MGTTKDIREAVNAELKYDPLVNDADIHVVNKADRPGADLTVKQLRESLRLSNRYNLRNHSGAEIDDPRRH